MRFPLGAIALGSLILSGCDMTGGASSSSSNSNGNSSTGQAAVQILATADQGAANSSVQAIQNMPDQIGGRLDAATRANLDSANATFHSDLKANPKNTSASFGVAVTALALKLDEFSDTLNRMWNNGLKVGTSTPSAMFRALPAQVVQSQVASARVLSTASDSLATIHGLQNTLEANFLPTVDSVVTLLQTCWNDPNFTYRFPVTGFSDRDSLTIGRGDVGIALASVQAVRDYLVWMLSQDFEVGVSGQGFPNDYAWLDTLGNIDDSLGPKGTFQLDAFQNLQTLVPQTGGTFLAVKSGDLTRVQGIPADLLLAVATGKAAAAYASKYQTDDRSGLVQIDPSDLASIDQELDSVTTYLSGPHTFVQPPHTEVSYDYSCWDTASYYSTCPQPPAIQTTYSGYSITVDVSKLITMPDHKVFLPKFQWNSVSDWATKGPYSLVNGTTITTERWLNDNDPSVSDLNGKMVWADPTFAGAFPKFKSSGDVLAKLDSLNEKPISSAPFAGRLLPRAVGL
jgi:outer membrane murein-binding lipoprotein Lpp